MTDNKLTDEQIIEAFERCCNGELGRCKNCPVKIAGKKACIDELHKLVFDVLHRQKAEIENLKADKDALINGQLTLQKMYAEAIKEFAEGLKPMMFSYYDCLKESAEGRPYKGDTLMDYEVVDMIEDCIDNLVKEMVGE